MKIRSLLLGSLALAGVSGMAASANAADLAQGALTSLDVCDALGLSGLTISSDGNCLQVTGGVSYMFQWGDFRSTGTGSASGNTNIVKTGDDSYGIAAPGAGGTDVGRGNDWTSQMIAWLQFVGTADSDFGPAKAVVKLKSEQYLYSRNGYTYYDGDDTGGASTNFMAGDPAAAGKTITGQVGPSGTVLFDRAYVSVGDSTVLTAGKAGSIVNVGDDTPFNYLGLFNSSNVGDGVLWSKQTYAGVQTYANSGGKTGAVNFQTGGHVIQVVSSLGNGLTLKAGLEDLNDSLSYRAGTAIGVISYASDTLSAHLSVLAAGVLDGSPDATGFHAGFTGTFDKFQVRAAVAGDSTGYWNGLASAAATFDMFKLAVSGEYSHIGSANGTWQPNGTNSYGFGASASATVADGITLNLGGRYFDENSNTPNNEGYQLAASIADQLTETLQLTGEIGYYGSNKPETTANVGTAAAPNMQVQHNDVYYGSAAVAWAPGGGFTSSLKGEVYSNGAYVATFNAAKTFQ